MTLTRAKALFPARAKLTPYLNRRFELPRYRPTLDAETTSLGGAYSGGSSICVPMLYDLASFSQVSNSNVWFALNLKVRSIRVTAKFRLIAQ